MKEDVRSMRLDWRVSLRYACFIVLLTVLGGLRLAAETPETSPGFKLAASVTTISLTAGYDGQTVSISATALNGFTGTVDVTVSHLPAGVTATPSTFSLKPGTPRKVSLVASPEALGSTDVLIDGTSGSLTASTTFVVTIKVDALTHHFNAGRTGLNASEVILTHANVNDKQFGLLRILHVDGVVDAEPLYVSNIVVGGKERDVVYVVSEHDSVYAFDADTGAQLWKTSVLPTGEATATNGCSQITPEIGITATPVIDRHAGAHGTIFLVGTSEDDSGNYHHRVHALDIVTGVQLHAPTEVAATYPGTGANSSRGKVIFDANLYAERAGLLLMNGAIYTGWTSHCDGGPYTGWLIGYSESTLEQTSVLNLTPNGGQGSIWMAGSGLAADESGNIYFLDANGTFDTTLNSKGFPANSDFGNGFIKVSTVNGKLAVSDYFEMYDTVNESNNDEDLGSGGAMVLPDLKDDKGVTHYLAVGAGKDQNIYVVDRGNMGKFNPNNDTAIYQEIDGAIGGVWSMPAYYNNTVYYGGANDTLKAFSISNAKLATSPRAQSPTNFEYPGTTPSITAHGTENGIVWTVENSNPAVLHAYVAADLQELYNSNMAAKGRDHFGAGNKFITPLAVNGKVFVGTPDGVAVFGSRP
jgi:outer membrane protein assembly factor BamB